jgi:MarR family transcriptional regulator, organic hydroperoxide resistance regulator
MDNNENHRTPEEAARALFLAGGLLDPLRMRVWDEENLTLTQLRLLSYLKEEGGLSNAELAERLYVTRPSVSALLERLERGGFIRREVAPNDRRGIRIWLEDRGRKAVEHVASEPVAYIIGLMDSLTPEQVTSMALSLEAFVASGRARRARDLQAEASS